MNRRGEWKPKPVVSWPIKAKNGPLNKSLQVGQDKRMDGMNERADTTELSMFVCRAWREENVCGRMKGGKISFEDL